MSAELLVRHEAVAVGERAGVDATTRVNLVVDVGDVVLDRSPADHQALGNVAVTRAGG